MIRNAILRQYRAALKRRMNRLIGRHKDPYPTPPKGIILSPSVGHRVEALKMVPALAFPRGDSKAVLEKWQNQAREKLADLTGSSMVRGEPTITRVGPVIDCAGDLHRQCHFLRVRPDTDVPVHLICDSACDVPPEGWPVVIILVGSTSGVHLAWGESRVPVDHILLKCAEDLDLQAARQGCLAVCIEQVGYGDRFAWSLPKPSPSPSIDAVNHALLLGRTLMGEKAMDVSAALDWLLTTDTVKVDAKRLFLFGHSTVGTAALYSATSEPHLSGTLASGCIGRIRETLMNRRSTDGDGIVPGLLV